MTEYQVKRKFLRLTTWEEVRTAVQEMDVEVQRIIRDAGREVDYARLPRMEVYPDVSRDGEGRETAAFSVEVARYTMEGASDGAQ